MKRHHLGELAVASDFDCPESTEIKPGQAAARGDELLLRANESVALLKGRQLAS